MGINVLLAGLSFEVLQVVLDVVELTYPEAKIERALDITALQTKLSIDEITYSIIIFDEAMLADYIAIQQHIKNIISKEKIVVIHDPTSECELDDFSDQYSYISMPFSLDELQQKIKEARSA